MAQGHTTFFIGASLTTKFEISQGLRHRACVVMSERDDIRGDHVGRTSLLGLLIAHAPRFDQVAYMPTMIADLGVVAHFDWRRRGRLDSMAAIRGLESGFSRLACGHFIHSEIGNRSHCA